ncbi:C40 family peptidase [Nocardiopsis baichengensis]|uniref:C40 family peptidase n=1 Tax=Nocardiopsis baichengensis TaxID=280240 RepID=UPI00034A4717|nr:C40 family peptidase [Nocardiopsis baichengensis]
MRDRLRTCAGTTVAFAVAFSALGAPAWAEPEPDVADRPPVGAQRGTGPEPEPSGGDASPPVADAAALEEGTRVAPVGEPRSREYFAVTPEPLPDKAVRRVRGLDGVEAVEVVDAARVGVEGEETSVMGVEPGRFRNFAPRPSAESDEIWEGIAEGRIALSDDAGKQRGLDVGSEVDIAGADGDRSAEVWTHATSGVAGIDALVSRDLASDLGFPEGNGVIVSAPDADLWELKDRLEEVLGEEASLQLLSEDPEPRPSGARGEEVPGATLERVIANAEGMVGVPYVWGGESLAEGGFDCSGLLQWAFAEEGIAIPRVTHDQWYAGEHVEWEDARRGDLIFWRSDPTAPDYISHVAIYLGDGRMLEAPRTGLDVRVTDVRMADMAGVVRVHVD